MGNDANSGGNKPPVEKSAAQLSAEQTAAAAKANADAVEKAAVADSKLQSNFDKLKEEADKMRKRLEATEQAILAIAASANREVPAAQLLRIRNHTLDAEKATARLADIWHHQAKRQPGRAMPKTYMITPVGIAKANNLPPAIVSNCLDEGDAKACYYQALNADPSLTVKVDLMPPEAAAPEVDPPGDAANAA